MNPGFSGTFPITPDSRHGPTKNPVPKARPHSSGQARVTIEGKDYFLGPHGSPEADQAYRRILAQWLAREGPFAPNDFDPVTVAEVSAGYWLFAE